MSASAFAWAGVMDFVNLPLLAVSALVFLSVLAGLFSARIGFSFLLVFLAAGILAGENGPGGVRFDDVRLSFWVGNVALAVILLDGGLRTSFATFRTGLRPALLLATAGVVLCAGLTAVAGRLIVGLDLPAALLLGAIVGSTDAAAVFSLLQRSGVTLNERVAATLEIESGMNDPMAVYLTLAFLALLTGAGAAPGAASDSAAWAMALSFVRQFGWGLALGVPGGLAMAWLLRRLARLGLAGGARALLLVSGGLVVFAATGLLEGSGFLAVYLFGLIVANRAAAEAEPALAAMDGYAWLSQAGLFLLLGLLVTPSRLVADAVPALGVAAALIVVARPVAVWLCLKPLRFTGAEIGFIAWVGLRGAVPIVLALFPLLAGVPQAAQLFHVAFVVVLVSLLLQGSTIGLLARRLGVALPEAHDEAHQRAVYGDFMLDAGQSVGAVCQFYGLPEPDPAAGPPQAALGAWLAAALGRPPVLGDGVWLGRARLSVRELRDGQIRRVGLVLPTDRTDADGGT
ncbi:potassium/proton antiporter [Sphaerotilus montanus]|uniref:Cell volume regulation protein A n=1 Tax=Sphaerotilus montanus TaxID=522889 RepID=A0A7Y9QXH3_9BURK|nr:potassium/proton antiporter [Sphaerotilus montanus]NYG33231.1 cell volume regulation protein A [Sphaerotilus montanus]